MINLYTKVNGKTDKKMGKVNNNGLMDHSMTGNGKKIYNKEKGSTFIQMVKFMKENLVKVKLRVKVNTPIKMVQHMQETGLIINTMAKVLKTGKEMYMKGNTNSVKNTAKVNLYG